jgi:hypothetical protein
MIRKKMRRWQILNLHHLNLKFQCQVAGGAGRGREAGGGGSTGWYKSCNAPAVGANRGRPVYSLLQ